MYIEIDKDEYFVALCDHIIILNKKQIIFIGHGKRGYSGVFLNYSNPTAVQAYQAFTRTEDTYSYVQGKLKRAHPPSILSYTR